jgi:hypothetical protein
MRAGNFGVGKKMYPGAAAGGGAHRSFLQVDKQRCR